MKKYIIIALTVVSIIAFTNVNGLSKGRVDHRIWEELLSRHVSNGMVDYNGFQREESRLDQYLGLLEKIDPETLSRNDQYAFYINVYNALILKAIAEEYPVKNVKKVHSAWKKKKFPIAGKGVTLKEMEESLRFNFKDPRIHFALVRGSRSCPKLLPRAYTGDNINKLLNAQT